MINNTNKGYSFWLYIVSQEITKQRLYCHWSPISQTIQVRCVRHAGHCWKSKDELIINILLWIPGHWHTSFGRSVKTYNYRLCADTECRLERTYEKWGPIGMCGQRQWKESVSLHNLMKMMMMIFILKNNSDFIFKIVDVNLYKQYY